MPIPPPVPPPPPESYNSTSSLARLIRTTLTYDTNVMLAAIISLLLVILFVLLLHLYTRWFLVQARRQSHTSVTVPRVLGSRLHQRFTIIDTSNSDHSSGKLGLPVSIISSLPLFVYKVSSDDVDHNYGLECAICLCVFEEEEIGRKLPACGHAFHVECIDMWLHSHSTCPICRAAIQCNHSCKIDQLDIEIVDPDSNPTGLATNNREDLRLEIVTTISNHVVQPCEITNPDLDSNSTGLINDNQDLRLEFVTTKSNHVGETSETVDVASSFSIEEPQSSNKLLNSNSSRCGG